MGLIGKQIGKIAGGFLGKIAGNKKLGRKLGSMAGEELIPYKKGGMVKPKGKAKTQKALLHKGELVVPAHLVKDVSKTLKKKIKDNAKK